MYMLLLLNHITTKNHHQKTVHFKPERGVHFASEYPVYFLYSTIFVFNLWFK